MTFQPMPAADLAPLFTEARTHAGWCSDPVPAELLRQLYELARMGPTSMNCQPMRLVFVTTPEARERLLTAVNPTNTDKTRAAPVTAIVAFDSQFYEWMPKIWHNPAARDNFAGNTALAEATAFRNGSMQGAYLIMAARALGLDCGPMSGFNNAKLDAEFFPDGRWKSNFLCNLGRGDVAAVKPRQPRLAFEDACVVL
ncbi:MAG: malonic semialdehyde reductase [Rubrivivax sp.]|nr:malonic semialdehyde reductase [Rubrivivax sp.]